MPSWHEDRSFLCNYKKTDNFTEETNHALDTRDTTPAGWAIMSALRHHALDIKYYNTYGRRYDTLESHISMRGQKREVRTHYAGRLPLGMGVHPITGAPPTYAVRQRRGAVGWQPQPPPRPLSTCPQCYPPCAERAWRLHRAGPCTAML